MGKTDRRPSVRRESGDGPVGDRQVGATGLHHADEGTEHQVLGLLGAVLQLGLA
jgi:hypothetical protein